MFDSLHKQLKAFMAKTRKLPLPEGWGDDPLSEFQDICMNNELASFDRLNEYSRLLGNIDVIMESCVEQCLHQFFKGEDKTGMLLFTNAHNHFRATVRLATSGHCISAYPTGRAGLESALYGWHLLVKPEALEQWHSKPEPSDRDAFRQWSNEFKFSGITRLVEKNDQKLAAHLRYLHQQAIDFGAHPNKDALYSNIKIYKDNDNQTLVALTYLHPNGLLFSQTFRFLVEVGLVVLRLINLANQEVSKAVNLESYIVELHQQYEGLLPQVMANAQIPNTVKEGDRVKVVNKSETN